MESTPSPAPAAKHALDVRSIRTPADIPEAVQWHEGMLLSPQHFQQFAWRQEALLAYQVASIHPFPYGVRRLRINTALLEKERFKIEELEAVMPDGLSVFLDGGEGPSVDLGPIKERAAEEALTIHLGIRRRTRIEYAEAFNKRYQSVDGEEVVDENTGEGSLQIPRTRPHIRLFGKAPGNKYASFPVARVRWVDSHFELVRDFIPPLLEIAHPDLTTPDNPLTLLFERGRSLANQLRQRARDLSNRLRTEIAETDPMRTMETREAIRSLVSFLPQFESVLYTPGVHPYALWLALCNIIGGLATLGADNIPRPMHGVFDPDDLLATFEKGTAYVQQLVDEGVPEDYRSYRFQQDADDERVFRLPISDEWLDAGDYLLIGIRPRPGVREEDLRAWLSGSYIASDSMLAELESGRLRGAASAPFEGSERPAASQDTFLFTIERSLKFIRGGQPLVIFNKSGRGKPAALAITLFVKEEHSIAYRLTDDVFQELADQGLPEAILQSLQVLKDRGYGTREAFEKDMRDQIGGAVDQFQVRLFKAARTDRA